MIRPWGIAPLESTLAALFALAAAAAGTNRFSAANQTRARADGQSKPSMHRARASRATIACPAWRPFNIALTREEYIYIRKRIERHDYRRDVLYLRNTRRVRTLLNRKGACRS